MKRDAKRNGKLRDAKPPPSGPEVGAAAAAPAWIVDPAVKGPRKTFCVLGVARGGTSMVAGVLIQLGIAMGEKLDKDNLEDMEFLSHGGERDLFADPRYAQRRNEYVANARKLVEKRNAKHAAWGWKDPLAIYYLKEVYEDLRNCHFICVVRDPSAIAMREMLEVKVARPPRHIFTLMRQNLGEYERCAELIATRKRPTLLVSYERALRHPAEAVQTIHAFVRPESDRMDGDVIARIADYIVADRRTGDIDARISRAAGAPGVLYTPSSVRADKLFGNFSEYYTRLDSVACRATARDREIAVAVPPGAMAAEDLASWAVKVYALAAAASRGGDHATASVLASRILREFAARHPVVGLGPVAVGRAVDVDFAAVAAVADQLVGIFNILGFVHLVGEGNAAAAHDYFEAGFHLARKRIGEGRMAPPVISTGLIWWMAFHQALAAKAAGRLDSARRAIDGITSYLLEVRESGDDRMNPGMAREMYDRAVQAGLTSQGGAAARAAPEALAPR